MTELENYIQTCFGVSNDDLFKISQFFKPTTLKKKHYFLKTGRYCDRLGFMQSGIIREFVNIDDKEVTKWISTKGYFVVDLSSFVFHQTARWNIQALTDCELFVIDQKDYEQIDKVIARWMELEKLFIAKSEQCTNGTKCSRLACRPTGQRHQVKEIFNNQHLISMLNCKRNGVFP